MIYGLIDSCDAAADAEIADKGGGLYKVQYLVFSHLVQQTPRGSS
jgi:hypothetical protein